MATTQIACAVAVLPCRSRHHQSRSGVAQSSTGIVRSPLPRHIVAVKATSGEEKDAAVPLDVDALLAEIDMPDVGLGISHWQKEIGATFDENGVATTFGNDEQALEAITSGAVLVDMSRASRVRIGGEDARRFLHDQSTNSFKDLPKGTGRETCFVTAQGRLVDLATVLVQGSGCLVLLSEGMGKPVMERLSKYIFPADKVQLADVTSQTGQIVLAGPEASEILKELDVAGDFLTERPPNTHILVEFQGSPVIIAKCTGLATPGFTMISDENAISELWRSLALRGAIPMGSVAWERARILQGRPSTAELTEEHNPLETGLYSAVSLDKGCYIGQETLAKVHNLGALKSQLWGMRLQYGATCKPGDEVTNEAGERIGSVTSACLGEGDFWVAMAYLKSKSKGQAVDLRDSKVMINGAYAYVEDRAFLTRAFPEGQGPKTGAGEGKGAEEAEEEKLAKEEKLAAMQARLEAYQKQQKGEQAA